MSHQACSIVVPFVVADVAEAVCLTRAANFVEFVAVVVAIVAAAVFAVHGG